MSKMNKYLLIGGAVILVAIAVWLVFKPQGVLGLASTSFVNYASDVVGTKSGTSTTPVDFRVTATGGQSATTTYVSKLGDQINTAVYTLKTGNASTSANLHFSVLFSNDDYCSTATTTTIIII